MDVAANLAEMADEELARMSAVPWAAYARHIHERAPRTAGETYGCEIDDIYFDVGDQVVWQTEVDGDIVLTTFAATHHASAQRVERTTVIQRPV